MTANYPLNCWYVAATSDEVGRKPLGRTLLDRPVVLYRDEAGQVVALADRCAHRGYPLSKGRLEGDLLVCGYHGLRYDASGACVRVPLQPNVPYNACVQAYPVREAPPFIWVWPGDAKRSILRGVPDLPWLTDAGWSSSGTRRIVQANYMLVHEHYLDLTHIPELHPQETPPGIEAIPPLDSVQVSETSAAYTRTLPPAGLADWEAEATGLPRDRQYERRHYGTFISPAVLAEGWDIEGGDGRVYTQVRIQAVTPESPTRTHLVWRFARNYALDRAVVSQHLHDVFSQVAQVDIDVIETIQATTGYEGAAAGVRITADAGALHVRRVVEDMLTAESGHPARFGAARKTA